MPELFRIEREDASYHFSFWKWFVLSCFLRKVEMRSHTREQQILHS